MTTYLLDSNVLFALTVAEAPGYQVLAALLGAGIVLGNAALLRAGK